MRKSTLFCCFLGAQLLALLAMLGHSSVATRQAAPQIRAMTALVHRLQLTDLCLFTDARYTRNPSLSDLHSAFQDSPMSMEHFPSGALVPPPPHLRK